MTSIHSIGCVLLSSSKAYFTPVSDETVITTSSTESFGSSYISQLVRMQTAAKSR